MQQHLSWVGRPRVPNPTQTSAGAEFPALNDRSADLDALRRQMLEALPSMSRALSLRIGHARDLDELWNVRPELFTAIAQDAGEGAAYDAMAKINSFFGRRSKGCDSGARSTVRAWQVSKTGGAK